MPVTTPAMGMSTVGGQQRWYRFVRRLATRPGAELSLVYVPDGTHDRLAVMKRLPKALATDAMAVAKFRTEARIAALLEHPAIVRVLEVVETQDEDFYTMEYVRGADMRRLMDTLVAHKRTLPLDCVILIAIELCNALDHAHHLTDANGAPAPVLHRDLSPSKVLIGDDGSIKLTGFAAPPIAHQHPRRARTQSVGYTSPERWVGETMDARSDVFALGVLLYELSSGERLFADASTEQQIMQKILRGDMPRPSEVRRGYPRELETILMRALARERKDRYQSASELQVELETFLWARWPTASTAALAKLVSTTFPAGDDLANGSRELERIDPFTAIAAPPSDEPVLWLGPVPLAKPYPRGNEGPRDTKELRRLAPEKFPEASQAQVALGAPGAAASAGDLRSDRAVTVDTSQRGAAMGTARHNAAIDSARQNATTDELAIPVQDATPRPRRNANVLAQKPKVRQTQPVLLGTPGARPTPLPELVHDFKPEAPRGQYQRPRALDEHLPHDDADDDDGVTVARTRTSEESMVARVPVARVAVPRPETVIELVDRKVEGSAELDLDQASLVNWTMIPSPPAASPVEIARQRLPSPPPASIARASRKWPLGTIAAIIGVVVVGVMASAYAIRTTQHEASDLPEVVTAHPSPPTDVVLHTTQQAAPLPAAAIRDVKKPKARVKKEAPKPAAHAAQAPVDPRKLLFPPPDNLPIAPSAGSLDGLPSIKTIEVKGTTADAAVRTAVEQALSPLRGCYRAAARAKQLTPQVDLTIAFEFDVRRQPMKVRAVGGAPLDTLAACAAKVTSDVQDLPEPTKGTVRVSVSLEFRPNP